MDALLRNLIREFAYHKHRIPRQALAVRTAVRVIFILERERPIGLYTVRKIGIAALDHPKELFDLCPGQDLSLTPIGVYEFAQFVRFRDLLRSRVRLFEPRDWISQRGGFNSEVC